jgi:septal ring factor EnvC (AmiA/AmiB activator)
MKGFMPKASILVTAVVALFCASCREQELPGEKKSRVIAARRDQEIVKLNAQHEKQMKQQQGELAKCVERKEALEKQLQQNVKEQVESVLTEVVEESAKLQQQIKELKAEIERMRQQIQVKPKPVEAP